MRYGDESRHKTIEIRKVGGGEYEIVITTRHTLSGSALERIKSFMRWSDAEFFAFLQKHPDYLERLDGNDLQIAAELILLKSSLEWGDEQPEAIAPDDWLPVESEQNEHHPLSDRRNSEPFDFLSLIESMDD